MTFPKGILEKSTVETRDFFVGVTEMEELSIMSQSCLYVMVCVCSHLSMGKIRSNISSIQNNLPINRLKIGLDKNKIAIMTA